eukprot:jgi/Mesvir1/27636/Mv07366-RA.1
MSGMADVKHRLRYGCRPWEPPEHTPSQRPGHTPPLVSAVGNIGRRLFAQVILDVKNIAFSLLRVKGQAVHHLALSKSRQLTDDHVSAIARGCPKLLLLDVSYCHSVTDIGVAVVGKNCRRLRCLNISFCGNVGDQGLSVVVKGCPDLRQLFAANARVSDAFYCTLFDCAITLSAFSCAHAWTPRLGQLAPLLSRWRTLQHLDVAWCGQLQRGVVDHDLRTITLSPLSLDVIADSCPDLRYLDVSGLFVYGVLAALAQKCPELRTVVMEVAFALDADVLALARHCRQLHSLEIAGCEMVHDDAIQELARRCRLLERLGVAGCSGVSDASLMAIAEHCAYFQAISWAGSAITRKGIQRARQHLPSLCSDETVHPAAHPANTSDSYFS